MNNWMVKLDQALILAIHRNSRLKKLDRLFSFVTILGSGAFSFPFTVVCLLINLRLGSLLFITLTCCFLTVQLFKNKFLRWRPYYGLMEVQWYRKKDVESSFPSGHTAAAVAMAACLQDYVHFPSLLLLLAGLVGYSRVHLGDHYPSDVLCGALVGLSFALGVENFFKVPI